MFNLNIENYFLGRQDFILFSFNEIILTVGVKINSTKDSSWGFLFGELFVFFLNGISSALKIFTLYLLEDS